MAASRWVLIEATVARISSWWLGPRSSKSWTTAEERKPGSGPSIGTSGTGAVDGRVGDVGRIAVRARGGGLLIPVRREGGGGGVFSGLLEADQCGQRFREPVPFGERRQPEGVLDGRQHRRVVVNAVIDDIFRDQRRDHHSGNSGAQLVECERVYVSDIVGLRVSGWTPGRRRDMVEEAAASSQMMMSIDCSQ